MNSGDWTANGNLANTRLQPSKKENRTKQKYRFCKHESTFSAVVEAAEQHKTAAVELKRATAGGKKIKRNKCRKQKAPLESEIRSKQMKERSVLNSGSSRRNCALVCACLSARIYAVQTLVCVHTHMLMRIRIGALIKQTRCWRFVRNALKWDFCKKIKSQRKKRTVGCKTFLG